MLIRISKTNNHCMKYDAVKSTITFLTIFTNNKITASNDIEIKLMVEFKKRIRQPKESKCRNLIRNEKT